jgi:hypothetical protein
MSSKKLQINLHYNEENCQYLLARCNCHRLMKIKRLADISCIKYSGDTLVYKNSANIRLQLNIFSFDTLIEERCDPIISGINYRTCLTMWTAVSSKINLL